MHWQGIAPFYQVLKLFGGGGGGVQLYYQNPTKLRRKNNANFFNIVL